MVFSACVALVFSRAGVIDRTLLTLEFQSIACVSEARNVIFSKYTKRYFNSPYSACMCSCSCGLFHAPWRGITPLLVLDCTLLRVTFVRKQPLEECVLILSFWPLLLGSSDPRLTLPALSSAQLCSPGLLFLFLLCEGDVLTSLHFNLVSILLRQF